MIKYFLIYCGHYNSRGLVSFTDTEYLSNTIILYKNKGSSAVTNKLEGYRSILNNKKNENKKKLKNISYFRS